MELKHTYRKLYHYYLCDKEFHKNDEFVYRDESRRKKEVMTGSLCAILAKKFTSQNKTRMNIYVLKSMPTSMWICVSWGWCCGGMESYIFLLRSKKTLISSE